MPTAPPTPLGVKHDYSANLHPADFDPNLTLILLKYDGVVLEEPVRTLRQTFSALVLT